ncbi:hypothetical protein [Secundilactobacillus oryzae]|nr:hypothetical protein [Secundilactobacillus oryzae]
MDETIFFNPGDSIGNFHDYNEAVAKAQIYREKNNIENGHVLVVKGVDDNKSFDIFLADNTVSHVDSPANPESSKPYKVTERF